MSLVDARLELSSAQALTATADSTNVVDLTQTARQVGAGRPMYVHFNVTVAADFTSADETYTFAVATGAALTASSMLTSAKAATSDLTWASLTSAPDDLTTELRFASLTSLPSL